jgi:hypothetical protein
MKYKTNPIKRAMAGELVGKYAKYYSSPVEFYSIKLTVGTTLVANDTAELADKVATSYSDRAITHLHELTTEAT